MRQLSHHRLPIVAPEYIWSSLGWAVYDKSDEVGHRAQGEIDDLLALAFCNGLSGERAVAWAVTEHRRRYEDAVQNATAQKEAGAMEHLASAIERAVGDSGDFDAVQGIIGKLSPKTQFAVRSQLGLRAKNP